jgi:membrane-bound lytic murein transglycosylase D
MWQFMPATGRNFELAQNIFRDDRKDVLESTRAALDYLGRLYAMFGDWHLALAAYNWGEGNVQRAIERNRKRGKPTDYASLKMPAETRNYVPKLQAVKNIVARPGDFALTLPPLDNHPYFLTVEIERDIDVALAARLAAIDLDAFHALNPQFNKPVILAAGTPRILLPYDNANAFVRNLADYDRPTASWTAWTAPKTMRPSEAAKQVGMTEDELRDVNRIPLRMLIRAGSTLLVPRNGHHPDVSEHLADSATIVLAPDAPTRRVVVKVGRGGDTVRALARRHRVDPALVAQWNRVSATARLAAGTAVVLHLPTRSALKTIAKKPTQPVRTATKAKPKTRVKVAVGDRTPAR